MMAQRLAVWLCALLLGGCTLLPAADPVSSWRLQPPSAPAETAQTQAQQTQTKLSGLRINRLYSDELVDSVHLLVVPEGEPISAYRGVRWGERVPDLLRDYLLDALRLDGRFQRLSTDQVRLQAEYELVGRINVFQVEYERGEPRARLQGHLQLVRVADRQILSERGFSLEQPASDAQAASLVRAFSQLAQRYAHEVAEWLVASAPARRGA